MSRGGPGAALVCILASPLGPHQLVGLIHRVAGAQGLVARVGRGGGGGCRSDPEGGAKTPFWGQEPDQRAQAELKNHGGI